MLWLMFRRPRWFNLAAVAVILLSGGLYLNAVTSEGINDGSFIERIRSYCYYYAAAPQSKRTQLVRSVKTEQRVVALTFDDGPHPTVTPAILDILAAHGARATFFLLGEHCEKYPALVQRIVAEGHEAANHGYTHKFLGKMPLQVSVEDVDKTSRIIYQLTGCQPTFFRPPGGSRSDALLASLRDHGLITVLWSIDPRDWSNPGPARIRQRVLAGLRPGAIIILHDNREPSDTVAALPGLLADLAERGYRVVTVGDLLALNGERLVDGRGGVSMALAISPFTGR